MAKYIGNDGVVKIADHGDNPAQLAQIVSFTVDESASNVRCDSIGDAFEEYKTAKKSWSGSITLRKDSLLTPQQSLRAGAKVDLELYPEGASSGLEKITGTAIVSSRGTDVPLEDILSLNIEIQGTGALVIGAAA